MSASSDHRAAGLAEVIRRLGPKALEWCPREVDDFVAAYARVQELREELIRMGVSEKDLDAQAAASGIAAKLRVSLKRSRGHSLTKLCP